MLEVRKRRPGRRRWRPERRQSRRPERRRMRRPGGRRPSRTWWWSDGLMKSKALRMPDLEEVVLQWWFKASPSSY
jgi:hypothetical protein